jgi:hypothetical protein
MDGETDQVTLLSAQGIICWMDSEADQGILFST